MSEIDITDILVIGSGGAGCRAALEAFHAGAHVTLVTKGAIGRSGTTAFRVADTAGYNAADGIVDPEDSPGKHYGDIIQAGLGMAYEDLAEILTAEALETVPFLERMGVKFERDPATGRFIEVKGCFASRPRMHILKNHGEPIIRAMVPVISSLPIKIVEHMIISRLLVREGRCVGAIGIDGEGRTVIFRAKAVVLCCGGAGRLFKYTLTPPDITGDGYALGLRAGADLVNMEFMQVVLGTVAPSKNQLNTFLWCAKPRLLSSSGEPLLDGYLPADITAGQCMAEKATHFPFSTRDNSKFIEIAVQKEMLKTKIDGGGAFLDLREVTDEVVAQLPADSPLPKLWPLIKEFMTSRGFSIEKEPFPIACFAHAINGGIKIDVNGQSTLSGLYAAGEVAGGPHGADRLGGNMLVTCQVFGARAGKAASEEAAEFDHVPLPHEQVRAEEEHLGALRHRGGPLTVQELRRQLQEAMWRGVLVVRRNEGLLKTLDELENIRSDSSKANVGDINDLRSVIELENLIDVGLVITRAALRRTETRGSHYREDFPTTTPSWRKRILMRYESGELIDREEPVQ